MTDAGAETDETERTVVKTYVPRYQKEQWREAAEAMDMSQSEFVRTMVQAGRRDFDLGGRNDGGAETGSPDANPGGEALETRLLDVLERDEFLTWDELVAAVTENVEDRLEEALQSLTREGRVEHSPRRGGYALAEAER